MREPRDIDAERAFLHSINQLDYVLLQRNWDSPLHGDLDLAITAKHWPELVLVLVKFSENHHYPIVKVYEIEYAVICIILLTEKGWLHLDIAITPHVQEIFSVNLQRAIETREAIENIYVLTTVHADAYTVEKKRYKNSSTRKFFRRLANMPVIFRRLASHLRLIRGACLYIPYIVDEHILRSPVVQKHATSYLTNNMRNRYE